MAAIQIVKGLETSIHKSPLDALVLSRCLSGWISKITFSWKMIWYLDLKIFIDFVLKLLDNQLHFYGNFSYCYTRNFRTIPSGLSKSVSSLMQMNFFGLFLRSSVKAITSLTLEVKRFKDKYEMGSSTTSWG